MSRVRVQSFSVSLDGFGTGDGQSLETPFGPAGERLHEWMFATRWGGETFGQAGGSGGVDDALARLFAPGVGAEIMGAGKFGPPGWQEDPAWRGWWGSNPPFHTPTFILTHHPRPSIEMEGERLWDGMEGLERDYDIESVSSPSGVTHLTFSRAGA